MEKDMENKMVAKNQNVCMVGRTKTDFNMGQNPKKRILRPFKMLSM